MAMKELQPSQLKIDRLIYSITDGSIKIPPFQRRFVWKKEQIIALLDSIFHDYPIGSVLFWSSNEDLPASRNVGCFKLPEKKPDYPVNYVLDGQQRITTLFAVLGQKLEQAADDYYAPDESLFEVYFDINASTFRHKEDLDSDHTNLPLRLLYNNYDFNKEIGDSTRYGRSQNEAAVQLQSIFQNYEIPIVTTSKREKEEVGIIFERINNTGTDLKLTELLVAWTWKEDYSLKGKIDDITEELNGKSFGDVDPKIILQALSGIVRKTTSTKSIMALSPSEVRDNTDILKESILRTVDFLSTQFCIFSDGFLPNHHILVPLTYFFSKTSAPTADQATALKRWFWRVSFSNRYYGATDAKMDADIGFFDEVLLGHRTKLDTYKVDLSRDYFEKNVLSKNDSIIRACFLVLAQKTPKDLTNGNAIDLGQSLSVYNRKEFHHVFPRAFLLKRNTPIERINVMANFCFLPAASNKRISSKAPSDYMRTIVPQDQLSEILSTNLLPENMDIYENDNFDAYIRDRGALLIAEIERLTGLSW